MKKKIMRVTLDESLYIHKTICPRMLENVYKTCLAYRLRQRGLFVEMEKPVPVIFEEIRIECGYRNGIKEYLMDLKIQKS